jgi:hypothetical protein
MIKGDEAGQLLNTTCDSASQHFLLNIAGLSRPGQNCFEQWPILQKA